MTYIQQIASFRDTDNHPLSYGHIYLYDSLTGIPITTYGSSGNSFIENPWPYVLDYFGTATNLYLKDTDTGPFRMNLTDKNDAQMPDFPIDNLLGVIQIVNNPPFAYIMPSISYIPDNPTLTVNSPYRMMPNVVGDNLSFQWFKNDIAIPGANTINLTFDAIQLTDAGVYYLEIWNALDIKTSQKNTITVI